MDDAPGQKHCAVCGCSSSCGCPCHDRPLMPELLDLVTLMPDTQTQEIIDYIVALREARGMRGTTSKPDWFSEREENR